jgi:dienelactone hydrolase
MLFGGFQGAARVLDLIDGAKLPPSVLLASFDYPFKPPRRFSFPGSLQYAPDVKRMMSETVEGIVWLARELARRPDVDPNRITVIGASLGAPFVIEAAAREPLIRGVALIHGSGGCSACVAKRAKCADD